MLDISLALIFSQLPHPECWMPRLPLEALNCFWLALPAWFLVLAWFSCLCGGGGVRLQTLLLFMCVCNWPLAAEVPVHCEVCVRLWSFYCLHRITTVLIVQCCSPLSPHPPHPWLKPYWYSAHRLSLIQMWCVFRTGSLDLSSLFLLYYCAVLSFSLSSSSPILTAVGFSRSPPARQIPGSQR